MTLESQFLSKKITRFTSARFIPDGEPNPFFLLGGGNVLTMLTTRLSCYYETQEQLYSAALPDTIDDFYWIHTQDLWVSTTVSSAVVKIVLPRWQE